jgi:hypothetical protein
MAVEGSLVRVAPTLEVRWIRPGALTIPMIEWFGRFVGEVETREDTYLVGQRLAGLSVKIRGGALLEVKVTSEDRGIVDVPGCARGRIQSLKKWSFPIPLLPETVCEPPDWVRVGKMRRIVRFSFANGRLRPRGSGFAEDGLSCVVELTDVTLGEDPWWTLGFEVAASSTIKGAIEATAADVFGEPLPDIPKLSVADSMSYSEWLCLLS